VRGGKVEAFKIAIYEQKHGAGTFVPFRSLNGEESDQVFHQLKLRLKLPDKLDALQALGIISQRSVVVQGIDATQDDFDLKQVLGRLHFIAHDRLFVNWYRFDRIDEIGTDDLSRNFRDIWYPSSDDVDILDPKFGWILSIEHNGTVRKLGLTEGPRTERAN